ncbi:hypothetical protein [Psychrobacter sp. M13]|uniref:hypothetical protein n=1 Tax=Psychrobacter sp. M13 TaxID=3067275 RepID=UPI00273CA56C|nr:hypothetical protein [Psychrobacter sp. M13]WLP94348.1 hypothetical protein Q9G97_12335 [Psychrobacter sp. M13]
MNNFLAINEFLNEWRNTINFKVEPVGHLFFSARVTYDSIKYGVQRENCTVRVHRNGINDGDIEIFECGDFQSKSHHLGFTDNWQDYSYDKIDGSIIVDGKSEKMGGKYKVRICPNGIEPRL